MSTRRARSVRALGAAAVAFTALGALACDPCAGTPTCHTQPEISYTGQFIERYTGKPVGGVRVEFVKQSGVPTLIDTVRAESSTDGFFVIRMGAYLNGSITGKMRMTPPPPYAEYTVDGLQLSTTRTRGDGGMLGQFVVNPYLQLLGEMHDGATQAPLADATVTLRVLNDPPVVEPATFVAATAENGRFLWDPVPVGYDTLHVDVEVRHPLYPGPLHVKRDIPLQVTDGPPYFLWLALGRTMQYVVYSARRGTGEKVAGVHVEFTRTAGIPVQREVIVANVGGDGLVVLDPGPLDAGKLTGTLTIRPPAPFPEEVYPGIELETRDEYVAAYLGGFGYGAAATLKANFVRRSDDQPLAAGTLVRVFPSGGIPVTGIPGDIGVRSLDDKGSVSFAAATADTGQVLFDIEVWNPKPVPWDTIRAVAVPARYSDAPGVVRTFRVGPP